LARDLYLFLFNFSNIKKEKRKKKKKEKFKGFTKDLKEQTYINADCCAPVWCINIPSHWQSLP